ncbi:LTA synthase family protein [Paenibacillus thalictri]|uniref:LTA synthase family protein n=1 Tax=Paenibacillus thalictri TaxID=2527873 RepID=A0A4Q9DX37_9BACL|nr:LTA synthase family protein [Paenibacillus thalictri]TBL80392.1 LTA synthase family protein [Paenibacillus thalictri]
MNPIKRIRKRTASLERNPLIKYAFILLVLIAAPFLLMFGMEFVQRGSITGTLGWISGNLPIASLNALLVLFLLLLLYSLLGSLFISVSLSTIVVGLMSLINYFKSSLVGQPFFPWDIMQHKESMDIASLVTGSAQLRIIVMVGVAVVAVLAVTLLLPRLSMPLMYRAGFAVLSLVALYSFSMKTAEIGKILDRAGVSEIVWNQEQNYGDNGLALAFTMNVKNSIVAKPEGYNEAAIAQVAQNLATPQAKLASLPASSDGQSPNVIFIMNEAFWDPTLLPGVTFSEDPVPTIHQLQKESTSGYLLSPQFGGGTSNVEFEVLTGDSMSFLPNGSVPYQQYISKPVPTLASYFEDKGYKSMAIHSYEGWFWNREQVYKQMGFEGFMSKDHFDNPEYKGDFISDQEVAKSIIKQVDDSERPSFIYAVTMQNHGPYDDMRYGTNPIKAEGNLSEQAKNILETYTQGAHDADQSLKTLIDHYSNSDQPTIIVFYGDHLPMLGNDYQVYKEGGFISSSNTSEWSLEETKKMHSVPLVVWSNFDMPQEQVPTISDSFLGAYILDRLNMEKPAQFALSSEVFKSVPGLLGGLVVDKDQNLHTSVPAEAESLVNDYRQVQYDQLFGKQYLAGYIDHDYLTKAALPNYNAEFAQKDPESTLNADEKE